MTKRTKKDWQQIMQARKEFAGTNKQFCFERNISKNYARPSLLSQLILSKYQHELPLYRQEVIFKQLGIQLCRQTMSDGLIKIADVLHQSMEPNRHL